MGAKRGGYVLACDSIQDESGKKSALGEWIAHHLRWRLFDLKEETFTQGVAWTNFSYITNTTQFRSAKIQVVYGAQADTAPDTMIKSQSSTFILRPIYSIAGGGCGNNGPDPYQCTLAIMSGTRCLPPGSGGTRCLIESRVIQETIRAEAFEKKYLVKAPK